MRPQTLPEGIEDELPEVARVVVVDRIPSVGKEERVVEHERRRRSICRQLRIAPAMEHLADHVLVCIGK